MGQEQFQAMMPYITDDLIAMIIRRQNLTEAEAVRRVYESRLYALLEQEETKLWQYSTDMLYSLFAEEQQSGTISFPDV